MQKKGFSNIISDIFDIPLDGISDIPNAELIGNTFFNVDGCTGIIKYEKNEIALRSKDFILKIVGEELIVTVFSQGRVSIRGFIKSYEIEKVK